MKQLNINTDISNVKTLVLLEIILIITNNRINSSHSIFNSIYIYRLTKNISLYLKFSKSKVNQIRRHTGTCEGTVTPTHYIVVHDINRSLPQLVRTVLVPPTHKCAHKATNLVGLNV